MKPTTFNYVVELSREAVTFLGTLEESEQSKLIERLVMGEMSYRADNAAREAMQLRADQRRASFKSATTK